MAQYIRHETRHPEAGKWGRSVSMWHRLEWLEEGDGSGIDGASACDTYLSPPYLPAPPSEYVSTCKRCLKLASLAT